MRVKRTSGPSQDLSWRRLLSKNSCERSEGTQYGDGALDSHVIIVLQICDTKVDKDYHFMRDEKFFVISDSNSHFFVM